MFPEPTKLLLIGCLIESMWTQKSKSSTLTPRTNLQTYWQREISHVMNGIIILCLFNISHFSAVNSLKAMSKRTQEDAGEARVTAKSKPMMNLVSRCSVRDACLYCITKPGWNQTKKSGSTSELVEWAATKNKETCDGRQLIRLLRMEHWRQVVFSRVEIWWNVGSKNGDTRGWTRIHPRDRQVCHRWRGYGL